MWIDIYWGMLGKDLHVIIKRHTKKSSLYPMDAGTFEYNMWKWSTHLANVGKRGLRTNLTNQGWVACKWKKNRALTMYWRTGSNPWSIHLRILCYGRLLLKQFESGFYDNFIQIIWTNTEGFICLLFFYFLGCL